MNSKNNIAAICIFFHPFRQKLVSFIIVKASISVKQKQQYRILFHTAAILTNVLVFYLCILKIYKDLDFLILALCSSQQKLFNNLCKTIFGGIVQRALPRIVQQIYICAGFNQQSCDIIMALVSCQNQWSFSVQISDIDICSAQK